MLAPLRYLLPAASTLIRPDTPAGRLNDSQRLFLYQVLVNSLKNRASFLSPSSASAVWALTSVACFLVRPGYGLAGESGLLPPAECWGGMQGACCLRSTLAVCPGDKPRSEFTTRPPQHSDKGTHAQRGQGTRQDKPYPGHTRKPSTGLTQSPNGTSRRKPPQKKRLPGNPQPFNPKLKAQKSRYTPFKNQDQGFKTNNINLTHLLYFSDTGQGTTLH